MLTIPTCHSEGVDVSSSDNIASGSSDDYAYMKVGDLDFYYGYERTDDEGRWCFTATRGHAEVVRVPYTELGFGASEFDVDRNLLYGIGLFIRDHLGAGNCQ